MRWQQLFADLEAQFDEAETAGVRAETASRIRAEVGAVRLDQRLRGAMGCSLSARCRGAGTVAGVLVDVGPDWLLLEQDLRREVLVAAAALTSVSGLTSRTAAPVDPGPVRGRLDLRWALRQLARDRSPVQVVLDDGAVLTGTVDRVGADFVELAEHSTDQPRRTEAVRGVQAVVMGAIAVVHRLAPGFD